jgi:hypothetical protein
MFDIGVTAALIVAASWVTRPAVSVIAVAAITSAVIGPPIFGTLSFRTILSTIPRTLSFRTILSTIPRTLPFRMIFSTFAPGSIPRTLSFLFPLGAILGFVRSTRRLVSARAPRVGVEIAVIASWAVRIRTITAI